MYNYAHIPPALLSHAEEEATTIFRQAGVEAAWVDCPLSGAELDRFPGCQQPMGRADFALRILSAAMTERAPAGGEALGFALPCPEDLTGCYADVLYQRISDWASGAEISAYQLLGHAMAHEVGHLLLGSNSHSRDGIMRPQWNPDDLRVIARASLRFTPRQAELVPSRLFRADSKRGNRSEDKRCASKIAPGPPGHTAPEPELPKGSEGVYELTDSSQPTQDQVQKLASSRAREPACKNPFACFATLATFRR